MITPEKTKLQAARETAKIARLYLQKRDAESIYRELHDNYFVFDAQNGSWHFNPQATLTMKGGA